MNFCSTNRPLIFLKRYALAILSNSLTETNTLAYFAPLSVTKSRRYETVTFGQRVFVSTQAFSAASNICKRGQELPPSLAPISTYMSIPLEWSTLVLPRNIRLCLKRVPRAHTRSLSGALRKEKQLFSIDSCAQCYKTFYDRYL
jgi:hypothetical protein